MRTPDAAHAARPFALTGCIELREILGRRARDERELMGEVEQAPAEGIYYHNDRGVPRRPPAQSSSSHPDSVFLRRPLVASAYPNDFATWVATQIRDQVLAERLGMGDPVLPGHGGGLCGGVAGR